MHEAQCPLVSVLIASYNHEAYIKKALESVLQQTYKNIELIVVDDASTDQSVKYIHEVLNQSNISTKVHVNESNSGICTTLNSALSFASGEFVALLASDDFYESRFIELMVDEILKHGSKDVVLHCDSYSVDESDIIRGTIHSRANKPPTSGRAFWSLAEGSCKIVSVTMFTRRSLLERVGGFDERLKAEDFDIHLRMARIAEFVFLPSCLVYSRTVHGSLGRRTHVWAQDVITALNKHRDLDLERIKRISEVRIITLANRLCFEGNLMYAVNFLFNNRGSFYIYRVVYNFPLFVTSFVKGFLWRCGVRRPEWF